MPLDTIKEAEGFYKKDRYIPIIQAIINIILSIILAGKMGLNGVLLGTTISYLLTVFWIKPLLLDKYIFEEKSTSYFLNQFKYVITIIIIYLVSSGIIHYINLPINIITIIVNGIITTIIFGLIISLFYFRNSNFKFMINTVKNMFLRK